MAKNKNGVSRLTTGFPNARGQGSNLAKSLTQVAVSSPASSQGRTSKPPALGGIRTLSLGAKDRPTSIVFGKPSSSKTTPSKSSNAWTSLLSKTSSGGIAGGLSGGLGSLAGLGGLFSSIASLFGGGGKAAPPPLVDFQLPSSVAQTIYVGAKDSTAYQGTTIEKPTASAPSTGATPTNQSLQYQSTAIAQAVKKALLTSSSLNDVIASI